MFVFDDVITGSRNSRWKKWLTARQTEFKAMGLNTAMLDHAAFGGATNARHLVVFGRNIGSVEDFVPKEGIPRVLKHLIESASPGFHQHIEAPPPLISTEGCFSRESNSGPRFGQETGQPRGLSRSHSARAVLKGGSYLRPEGLLDANRPRQAIACPSVFAKPTRWVKRPLTFKETCRAYDLPTWMDKPLKADRGCDDLPFFTSLAPLVTTALFKTLWGVDSRGGTPRKALGTEFMREDSLPQQETMRRPTKLKSTLATIAEHNMNDRMNMESGGGEHTPSNLENKVLHDDSVVTEDSYRDSSDDDTSCYPELRHRELSDSEESSDSEASMRDEDLFELETVYSDGEAEDEQQWDDLSLGRLEEDPTPMVPRQIPRESTCSATLEENTEEKETLAFEPSQDVLDAIKSNHDKAKAVKSDDAAVPQYIWDQRVLRQKVEPTPLQERVLKNMREKWLIRKFKFMLRKSCVIYLQETYGEEGNKNKWMMMPRYEKRGITSLGADLLALQSIVEHSLEVTWFTYEAGSRVNFFRFPKRYRKMARDGVPIFFVDKGPDSMRPQPKVKNDKERSVLRAKIGKVVKSKYLKKPAKKLKSLIKFFTVPKGQDDWRVVYHAAANDLNNRVWAPSFWLPNVETLLRQVDTSTWMADRDIGEMFLNFQLHPDVQPYTGIDVGPLKFDAGEVAERWLCWDRNLMGFKPSPYNSVKMNLIAEEIIKGDRHDTSQVDGKDRNPFQWDHIELNMPTTAKYVPNKPWLSKRRKDGSMASDFVTFVDDERVTGQSEERVWEAEHALGSKQSYLGVQDASRKARPANPPIPSRKNPDPKKEHLPTPVPQAWSGSVLVNDEDEGVAVLTSQEKWDKTKAIIEKWHARVKRGDKNLDHTELRSDRGFLVYTTRPYPALVPFLKGIHLSLETWRGGRDEEGWRVKIDVDRILLDEKLGKTAPRENAPASGITTAVPRLKQDLDALLKLTRSDKPPYRIVRAKVVVNAFYGFVDASGDGFGGTVERPDGIGVRLGLWASDADGSSSNYRELRNLTETVEEEAELGHLRNAELWIFTDNSTAEACFWKGTSSSKELHALVLRLRQAEMYGGFTLHVVHVAGTRMIAQGTDGVSRGHLMDGVMGGRSMLDFLDLAKTAVERHPPILDWVRSWTENPNLEPLTPEEWFVEGHGITGGYRDNHDVWIPNHAPNGKIYLWTPPPVVADAPLEECLKAIHKRTDAFHVFLIPRLYAPRWQRLFYKCCDFVFQLKAGSQLWPAHMHEPLYVGIALPLIRHRPYTLRNTPALVGMGRILRSLFAEGEEDGRDILRQLLLLPKRVASLPELLARGVLCLPSPEGNVPSQGIRGRAWKPVAQAGRKRASVESRS